MSTTTAILSLVKNADGDNARTALSTNLPANMDKLDAVLAGTDAYKIPNAALAVGPLVHSITDSGYINETKTVTDLAGVYYLHKNNANNEDSSATTFNITGCPDADGMVIHIFAVAQKGATTGSFASNVTVQVHGTEVISQFQAIGTGIVTTGKSCIAARFYGGWQVLPDWLDGSKLTAGTVPNAALAADVRPAARISHSVAQSIANSTATYLAFNTEQYDTDTMHDNVTLNTRLVARTAGKYHITGEAVFGTNSTGRRVLIIRVNGGDDIAQLEIGNAGAAIGTTLGVSADWEFAAASYVELVAYQSSGGALNIEAYATHSPHLAMHRIG